MKFIQPKRGKKEDVKIIDINADDLRPDNTEWLRNITDEVSESNNAKEYRKMCFRRKCTEILFLAFLQSQAPVRKSKGLGGMVKRKHQITYLAFEAKAREQELKNQWAQNRANKMATKNKYGF